MLLDRDAAEVERRARELCDRGWRATAYGVDLTEPESIARVAEEIGTVGEGRVRALVNAAGGFAMSGPLAGSDPALFQRMITINLTTAVLTTRCILPFVRASRGAVLFFTSPAALPEGKAAEMSAYVAAKAGLVGFMRAIAAEEAAHGVRVNAIAPQAIRTAANVEAMGRDARFVEMETIVATADWLCSDAASGITGQIVRLG